MDFTKNANEIDFNNFEMILSILKKAKFMDDVYFNKLGDYLDNQRMGIVLKHELQEISKATNNAQKLIEMKDEIVYFKKNISDEQNNANRELHELMMVTHESLCKYVPDEEDKNEDEA